MKIRNVIGMLLLLSAVAINAQGLRVQNDSRWPIQVVYTLKSSPTDVRYQVVEPGEWSAPLFDLFDYTAVMRVEGYGATWSYASPAKDTAPLLENYLNENIGSGDVSEKRYKKISRDNVDVVMRIKSIQPGFWSPRGDWDVSFEMAPKGEFRLPQGVTLENAVDVPSVLWSTRKVLGSATDFDIARTQFGIAVDRAPSLNQLKDRKSFMMNELDRLLAAAVATKDAGLVSSAKHTIGEEKKAVEAKYKLLKDHYKL